MSGKEVSQLTDQNVKRNSEVGTVSPTVKTYSKQPTMTPQQTNTSAGEMFIIQQKKIEEERERKRQQRQQRIQLQLQQSEQQNPIDLPQETQQLSQQMPHAQPATIQALEEHLSSKKSQQPTCRQQQYPKSRLNRTFTLSRVISGKPNQHGRSKKTYQGPRARHEANELRSRPDPLEDMPADLSINFSKWFYGDLRHFKPRSRDQNHNQSDPRSTVERYLERQINEQMDPQRFKFLTQDLQSCCDELEPVSKITRYNILLEEQIVSDYNESSGKSTKKLPKKGHSSTSNSGPRKQFLALKSQTVILDRRPMMSKLVNLKQNLNHRSSINNSNYNSLIEPHEDCDDSCDDWEYIEIDCDSEKYSNGEQLIR